MLKSVTLYTALALAANAAAADPAALKALRQGDMAKLTVHADPQALPEATLTDVDGDEVKLASYFGEPVVLNFWATWCGPCREEMPALDRLQVEMGDRLEVVTVATGRPSPEAIRRFFDSTGLEHLPMLTDPEQTLARELGVRGLPVTVLVDPQGREVARLAGAAAWNAAPAQAILSELAEN